MMYRYINMWMNSNVMRCNVNRCICMHHRYFRVVNEWRFNVMVDRGNVMHDLSIMMHRHCNVRSGNMNWCISMHDRYFWVMKLWLSMMDRGNVMNDRSFDMMDRDSNMRGCNYIMMYCCFNYVRLLGMDWNVGRCNNMCRDCVMYGNSVMSSDRIQDNGSMMR